MTAGGSVEPDPDPDPQPPATIASAATASAPAELHHEPMSRPKSPTRLLRFSTFEKTSQIQLLGMRPRGYPALTASKQITG
jgi:hypothetical protein